MLSAEDRRTILNQFNILSEGVTFLEMCEPTRYEFMAYEMYAVMLPAYLKHTPDNPTENNALISEVFLELIENHPKNDAERELLATHMNGVRARRMINIVKRASHPEHNLKRLINIGYDIRSNDGERAAHLLVYAFTPGLAHMIFLFLFGNSFHPRTDVSAKGLFSYIANECRGTIMCQMDGDEHTSDAMEPNFEYEFRMIPYGEELLIRKRCLENGDAASGICDRCSRIWSIHNAYMSFLVNSFSLFGLLYLRSEIW